MVLRDGGVRGRVSTLFAAVGGARAVYAGMRRRPPGEAALWERRNHAGRTVDLYAGPAVTVGTALAVATSPVLPPRARAAAALAVLAAGACGTYDDLCGGREGHRGFRAHARALRGGRVTSGSVKFFGIGAAGLAAGALVKQRPLDRLLAGVVVAGSAHLLNLLDVRPGRAVKTVLVAGGLGMLAPTRRGGGGIADAATLSAAPFGAAAAILADDLGERTMLGDTGAHALGAALGVAVVAGSGRVALALHAAAVVAAVVAGDVLGDGSAWRERPLLRAWDALGRFPESAGVYSRGATPVRPAGATGR